MAIAEDELLAFAWLGREVGFDVLEQEVIFRDLCSGCGSCSAVCPENVIEVDELPRLTGKCTECAYCLMSCSRSYFSADEIEKKLFGEVSEEILGNSISKVGMRTKIEEFQTVVQDGGFVTTFLKYALEKGYIDGAIVSGVKAENRWYPEPKLVTNVKELPETAGTRYSNSANLSVLKEAGEKGLKKLAIVGLPCQIEAARKLQYYPFDDIKLGNIIKYTVSIFCTSNFKYEGLMHTLVRDTYGVNIEDIVKMDIKGKNVLVFTKNEKIEIPLKDAYKHKREGCKVCTDFTGRLADFATGSVGAPDSYNSVFARNEEAARLLDEMIDGNLFDVVKLSEDKKGLGVVNFLQQRKEKNAKKVIRKKIRGVLPLPFKNMKF